MTIGLESVPGVRLGEVIAEKYRVDRILGAGGMGIVVAAQHLLLDEPVALKFLLPEAAADAEAVARFDREARAAVKIKSEHVARVIDVGRLDTGSPFIVMEYLKGEDLSAWLAQRGRLPVDIGVTFILQACEAIAEAHSLGIIHRDLKPSNLFCVQRTDGQLSIKVLDFGISKVGASFGSMNDVAITRTMALVGSPLHMSPERLKGAKDADLRADIWSLGVILYEFFAGQPPFIADNITALVIKIATEPPVSMRQLHADIPPGLEQVIAKCLEKDPARRYQNVAELAVALSEFAPVHGRQSVERVLGTLRVVGVGGSGGFPEVRNASGVLAIPGPVGDKTRANWGNTGPTAMEVEHRKAVFAVAVGTIVMLGVLVGGIGVALSRSSVATSGSAPGSSVTPPFLSAAVSPTPPASEATTENAVAPIAPPSQASAAATSSSSPFTSSTATSPTSTPTKAHSVPTFAAPPANCNPPYVIDAKGHRQYKPQCL